MKTEYLVVQSISMDVQITHGRFSDPSAAATFAGERIREIFTNQGKLLSLDVVKVQTTRVLTVTAGLKVTSVPALPATLCKFCGNPKDHPAHLLPQEGPIVGSDEHWFEPSSEAEAWPV